jgi:hypothetical protein
MKTILALIATTVIAVGLSFAQTSRPSGSSQGNYGRSTLNQSNSNTGQGSYDATSPGTSATGGATEQTNAGQGTSGTYATPGSSTGGSTYGQTTSSPGAQSQPGLNSADGTATSTTTGDTYSRSDNSSGTNWGWIGLIGLLGLFGLRPHQMGTREARHVEHRSTI